MRVSDLLRTKGTAVATIAPDHQVREAVDDLRQHGIGALVVSADGTTIDGIVSERDVVRQLAAQGPGVLDRRVSEVMTTEVVTCGRHDSLGQLMVTMTEQRMRHLPVVEEDRLVGLISIGDVVKARLAELEAEARHLSDYIASGR